MYKLAQLITNYKAALWCNLTLPTVVMDNVATFNGHASLSINNRIHMNLSIHISISHIFLQTTRECKSCYHDVTCFIYFYGEEI